MSKIAIPVYKSVATITGYKTSDGRVFENKTEADKWQHNVNRNDALFSLFREATDYYEEEHQHPTEEIEYRHIKEVLNALVWGLNIDYTIKTLIEIKEKYDTNTR